MRILKQLSLLFCMLLFASQAHAMLRGCVGLAERYIVRRSPSIFGAVGAGANYLNGGVPPLVPGQQPPFVGNPLLNAEPAAIPVVQRHFYGTTRGGGGFPDDDQGDDNNAGFVDLQLREEIERRGMQGQQELVEAVEVDGNGSEETEVVDDEIQFGEELLRRVSDEIYGIFIRPSVDGFRRDVLVRSDLVNFLGHIEFNRWDALTLASPLDQYVSRLLMRYFKAKYASEGTELPVMISCRVICEAFDAFKEDPARFFGDVERLEALAANEGVQVDDPEALERARRALYHVFVQPVVDEHRTRLLLRDNLLNCIGSIEINRLRSLDIACPREAYVADVMLRYFSVRHGSIDGNTPSCVGYSIFNQAMMDFENDPVRFVAELQQLEASAVNEVD